MARNADAFAADLAPVVAEIRASGATSLRAIAAELNARGRGDPARRTVKLSNVKTLLTRLEGGDVTLNA